MQEIINELDYLKDHRYDLESLVDSLNKYSNTPVENYLKMTELLREYEKVQFAIQRLEVVLWYVQQNQQ